MTNIIRPIWPAPAHIIAGVTTRNDGFSDAPFDSFNLAEHVGDNIEAVAKNRMLLATAISGEQNNHPGPQQWQWLEQTHSTHAVHIESVQAQAIAADASITSNHGVVCTVLTADCLPILLCDATGSHIAAIHAGWRGLAGGIVKNTVRALFESINANSINNSAEDTKNNPQPTIYAWLGPAIGPDHFEVGEDVKAAFLLAMDSMVLSSSKNQSPAEAYQQAFHSTGKNKYLADIYQLASIALNAAGVNHIYGGGFCTACEEKRFFSYRRNNVSGRMASFIFIRPH